MFMEPYYLGESSKINNMSLLQNCLQMADIVHARVGVWEGWLKFVIFR